ncbi:hypothetical protein BU24DRAFT_147470 [Aaosphaeria arxii CBS 175.79]|uniref:Uncharacterized protein n=1 Tax=Aaosphaeria arxii CBS 175.79 TaxID=1450172 RepID=A0A6A5XWI0_9PLEO|nr:uncharacterized protein BU24DRAFT_147470 [Aaosphaeria arxii CBS 175.79]KAF2017283.1 hypothetical protein BU24DRAFT_147470 [Aaosphaeria arxii CBS 175.79]
MKPRPSGFWSSVHPASCSTSTGGETVIIIIVIIIIIATIVKYQRKNKAKRLTVCTSIRYTRHPATTSTTAKSRNNSSTINQACAHTSRNFKYLCYVFSVCTISTTSTLVLLSILLSSLSEKVSCALMHALVALPSCAVHCPSPPLPFTFLPLRLRVFL